MKKLLMKKLSIKMLWNVDEESRSRHVEAKDEKADDEEIVYEENVGEEAEDEDAGIPLTLTDAEKG
jgi:hypothetical protein